MDNTRRSVIEEKHSNAMLLSTVVSMAAFDVYIFRLHPSFRANGRNSASLQHAVDFKLCKLCVRGGFCGYRHQKKRIFR